MLTSEWQEEEDGLGNKVGSITNLEDQRNVLGRCRCGYRASPCLIESADFIKEVDEVESGCLLLIVC